MPIRDGLRRLWRWAHALVGATPRLPATPTPRPDSPPPPHLSETLPVLITRPPARGEIVIGGALTVRMWIVGGLLVLSASPQETERSLASLLDHPDSAVRHDAERALAVLRPTPTTAAA